MSDEIKMEGAPTGCWVITKLYSAKGLAIDVKASGTNVAAALDDLYAGIQHGIEKYKMAAEAPKLGEPPIVQIALPTKQQVQLHTEDGLPVVNADGEPEMIELPKGTRVYTANAIWHDKTKTGKDVLKVTTLEEPYNTKYGVTAFHGGPDGWKTWPLGIEHQYKAPKQFAHVIIKDPEGEGKYPEVIRFQE